MEKIEHDENELTTITRITFQDAKKTVCLKCKDCGKEYQGQVRYMIARGLKPGRCGKCNKIAYNKRHRAFMEDIFRSNTLKQRKQKTLENKLINYILNATKKSV